jgi:archaea-specific DNA-binding protein
VNRVLLSEIEGIHLNVNTTFLSKVIEINQQPVMECALDILTELVKHKTITLKARGESIPIAVAVANVITENMLKGNSKILEITVDSENADGKYAYALISIIEITISKIN